MRSYPCGCHGASGLEPGPQGLGKSAAMRKDTGKEGSEDISDRRKSQQMLPGISAPGSVPGTQGGAEGAWTPHRGGAAVNVNRQFKTTTQRDKSGGGKQSQEATGRKSSSFYH